MHTSSRLDSPQETDTFTTGTFDEISLTGDDADNVLDASSFDGVVRLDGGGGADTLTGGRGTIRVWIVVCSGSSRCWPRCLAGR